MGQGTCPSLAKSFLCRTSTGRPVAVDTYVQVGWLPVDGCEVYVAISPLQTNRCPCIVCVY